MKLRILGTLVLALLLATVGVASATTTVFITAADFYCDSVSFTYSSHVSLGGQQLRIANANGDAVSGTIDVIPVEGSFDVTLELDEVQPEGTYLEIQTDAMGGWDTAPSFPGIATGNCEALNDEDDNEGAPLPEPPYRLGGENARLKLFVVDEGTANPVLAFYRVNEDASGTLIFFIPSSDLADLPANPDAPIEIYRSENGVYGFYKLPSGEYQVNAGPDAEGKVDVINFTGVPPTNVRRSQYNIYGAASSLDVVRGGYTVTIG